MRYTYQQGGRRGDAKKITAIKGWWESEKIFHDNQVLINWWEHSSRLGQVGGSTGGVDDKANFESNVTPGFRCRT